MWLLEIPTRSLPSDVSA